MRRRHDELAVRRAYLFRLWAEEYQREVLKNQKEKVFSQSRSTAYVVDTFIFKGFMGSDLPRGFLE